ncbi:Ferredoxin-fold anticodon binding domain, partial [Rhizoctonia solani]
MRFPLSTIITFVSLGLLALAHPGDDHDGSDMLTPSELAARELAADHRAELVRNCAPQIAAFEAERRAKRNTMMKRATGTDTAVAPKYSTIQNTTCVTAPEVTEEYYRTDLRETQSGVKLVLDIGVMATGAYGGFTTSSRLSDKFTWLRGGSETNANGVVECLTSTSQLTTIYPGFYTGRTIHIHTMIHTGWTKSTNGTIVSKSGSLRHIGQLFFQESLNDRVLALSPYTSTNQRRTLNTQDGIYAQQNSRGFNGVVATELLGSTISAGILASRLGVDLHPKAKMLAVQRCRQLGIFQIRRQLPATIINQNIPVCSRLSNYGAAKRQYSSIQGKRLHLQQGHPISTLRALIESHFTGFAYLNSLSPIVTTKQNFDDLGFGPDHPGRNKTDTYYLNEKTVLRTHTSAHEVDVFNAGERKWLLTADVYRRDEIDRSHYPVFHQMEGARVWGVTDKDMAELAAENAEWAKELKAADIIIEDDTRVGPQNPYQPEHNEAHAALVAANLKHSLNSMILKLFGGRTRGEPLKVRWIEAEFPWTTPSYEVEVWFQGKWLEILGCGVVKEPTLVRGGSIAWAFGLGLERIAMVLYSIPDIRLFWSKDPRFGSQFTQGEISTFQPFSKYPICYKDLSFWKPEGFHENDLCDVIREVASDLVEDILLTDTFTHPKTGKTSLCYRLNYRSMERSLTNEEVNSLHETIQKRAASQLGIEIR